LVYSCSAFSYESLHANDHVLLFDPSTLTVTISEDKTTNIQLISEHDEDVVVTFLYGDNLRGDPQGFISPLRNLTFKRHKQIQQTLYVRGLKEGHIIVQAHSQQINITNKDFLLINIAKSSILSKLIQIFGWVYFFAWSLSFYPQIILNFKRKSVVGLNFDYLALNLLGFFCYSVFNVGLYLSTDVQSQYFNLHPRGINPVLLNDVLFSIHAFIACLITLFQCLFFERATQRLSYITTTLIVVFVLFLSISSTVAVFHRIPSLTVLYFYSYVKLTITAIKYVPQVFYNYRRKSTEGWSIGNIVLDLTGGICSLLQMFLLALNYNDWSSLFGSPTKFGLGLLSIMFDIIFILQHFIFYKKKQYITLNSTVVEGNEEQHVNENSYSE
ncbi:unnamed protein product, partial [Didymodactylos carnosus]